MSIEDLESLQTLESMCSWSNQPPQVCPMDIEDHTVPAPTPETAPSPDETAPSPDETAPSPDPPADSTAQVFDLNDLLYLALQIEDQMAFNNAELLG